MCRTRARSKSKSTVHISPTENPGKIIFSYGEKRRRVDRLAAYVTSSRVFSHHRIKSKFHRRSIFSAGIASHIREQRRAASAESASLQCVTVFECKGIRYCSQGDFGIFQKFFYAIFSSFEYDTISSASSPKLLIAFISQLQQFSTIFSEFSNAIDFKR